MKSLGPIIRINPYEIHINDTDRDFREKLYPFTGTDVDKFWWSAGMFAGTIAALGTAGHKLYKLRRSAFSKFFSSAYLPRLEPIIRSLVDSMVSKITDQLHAGDIVNLDYAHAVLTRDIITEYCFSSSRHCLEQPDFASHYYDWAQLHCTFPPLMKQFPSLLTLIRMLPDWFVRCTDDAVWAIREQDAEYRQ